MSRSVRKALLSVIRSAGYDVRSRRKAERLLGLASLDIRTVLDIGANLGQSAQRFSRIFPAADFLCFEPLPSAFEQLQRYCQGHSKFRAFNVALGATDGTTQMRYHVKHSASSSLLDSTAEHVALCPDSREQTSAEVSMKRLDTVIESLDTPLQPDILVKIDAQGYENRILSGGLQTLRKARACILEICLDPLYEQQATFRECFLLLDELGYSYAGNLAQVCAADGHVIYLDAVFTRQSMNF